MSTTISEDLVAKLSEENNEAKDLVKIGSFRALSKKLKTISEDPRFAQFLKEDFDFNNEELIGSDVDRVRLEYEALRFRLFVFQHLGYYDSLREDKPSRFSETPPPDTEPISIDTLFFNLNKLRNANIIGVESLAKEAAAAYKEITARNKNQNLTFKNIYERQLWQEKAWLVLCNASEKLIQDKLNEAMGMLDAVKVFVFERLSAGENDAIGNLPDGRPKSFLCLTTKATLLSLIGKAMHMSGDLRGAEANYYRAIEFYTEKANNPKDIGADEDQDKKARINIIFQHRRTAQILIYGLQKVNAKEANLDRCKANILITELLLSNNDDEDETTFLVLDFSKAVIQRIEAGTNTGKLTEAKAKTLEVKRKLQVIAHKYLIAEVNFELAIVNHLLKNWDEAESLIEEVENYYKSYYGDSMYRMKANITILRSHIQRSKGQLLNSLVLAKEALEMSEKTSNNIIARIDAHICLAETCFSLEKIGNKTEVDPYRFFQTALHLNDERMKSPKVESICLLGLCKVSALRMEEEKSKAFWEKFLNIKQFCQYTFVFEDLAKLAEEEMSAFNNLFVINSQDGMLDYETHTNNLRIWLYSKAREGSATDEDVAKKLGISRQSVVAWKDKYKFARKKHSK